MARTRRFPQDLGRRAARRHGPDEARPGPEPWVLRPARFAADRRRIVTELRRNCAECVSSARAGALSPYGRPMTRRLAPAAALVLVVALAAAAVRPAAV